MATFDIDGNIPGAGAYVVGLVAASPDYSSQRRLGIEFMNGEAIAFYSFSHDQSAEENYDLGGVTHSGNTITGNFPHRRRPRPGQGACPVSLQRGRRTGSSSTGWPVRKPFRGSLHRILYISCFCCASPV